MRWQKARRSDNVEDRRGRSVGRGAKLGGGSILIVILAMAFGVDPSLVLGLTGSGERQPSRVEYRGSVEEEHLAEFSTRVLGASEDIWNQILPGQLGKRYREPTLVLFTDEVRSACGVQGAATGPFYCPADSKLYIDLGFYRVLKDRLGADGDFAQAYVIAHEVGHHVQNLLGQSRKIRAQQTRVGEAKKNELSVRIELQADYYAGVFAHHAQRMGLLEPGDIEEALRAAAAIGDDTLQRRPGRVARPESFTHGTSEQRARWFRKGFQSGDIRGGDTFSAKRL